MDELDVVPLARVLASHAIVLLAVAIVVLTAGVAALVAVVEAVARRRAPIRATASALGALGRRLPVVGALLARSADMVPGAYVSAHLAVGFGVLLSVLAFASVAHQTFGDDSVVAAFDEAFAAELHEQTTPRGQRVFAAISWLGSTSVLTTVTLVVAAVLLANRTVVLAVGWLGAQAGGALINVALKEAFARARPGLADPWLAESSWSFPSGHAMGTFIACGVASYLVLRDRRSWRRAVPVLAVALAWSVVMAFSRLYLGVHFASDVIAGLAAGAAWVGVCVSAMEVVHRRQRA